MSEPPDRPLKRRRGRPTKYRAEFEQQAYRLCLLGLTDVELSNFFEIEEKTLNRWKERYPNFCQSIIAGREGADQKVAEKLLHRAMGYSHKAVKIFMPAGATEPVYAEYIEHYPPDTQAASLWLRNRQPRRWRDKHDHVHTGPGGGPIEHALSDEAREMLELSRQGLGVPERPKMNGVGSTVGPKGNGAAKH